MFKNSTLNAGRFAVLSGLLASSLLYPLAGCIPMGELKGDRAMRKGDTEAARRQYQDTLTHALMMDFEFERIQKKWRRSSNASAEEPFEALQAQVAHAAPLSHAVDALTFRQQVRAQLMSRELVAKVDAYALSAIQRLATLPLTPEEVPKQLNALMDFRDQAVTLQADETLLKAIEQVLSTVAAVGLPAPTPATAYEQVQAVLEMQERLRARGLPGPADQALTRAAQAASRVVPTPLLPDKADDRMAQAIGMREQANRLGAGPEVDAFVVRQIGEAAAVLAARADAEAARNRYVPAQRWMVTAVKALPLDHPLRAHLKRLTEQGVAYHSSQAAAQVSNPEVALFHLGMVRALQGDTALSRWQSARGALASRFETVVAWQPQVEGCAAWNQRVTELLRTSKGKPLPLHVQLESCAVDARVVPLSKEVPYTTEESYVEVKRVQTGTELVRVEAGTRQYQCTRPSSLGPEVYWSGLCTEPVYENKQIPVYSDVAETHYRDVSRSLTYTIRQVRHEAVVSGQARVTYDDGTVLPVSVVSRQTPMAEEFAYTIPPRYLSKPSNPTPVSQRIPSNFTAENTLSSTVEAAANQLQNLASQAVRAHRASLSRAEGRAAEQQGDFVAAEKAYVLSILMNASATDEAAAWFDKTWGIDPGLARDLFSYQGATLVAPPAPVLEASKAYAPEPLTLRADPYLARTQDLEVVFTPKMNSEQNYKRGIEAARTHAELVTIDHKALPGDADRYTALFGVESHGALLANLLRPGWGLTVFDEIGFTGAVGGHLEDVKHYYDLDGTSGDSELRYSWLIRGDYSLMPGLRLHYISLFAGANAGIFFVRSGDTRTLQAHVEPAARLGLRFFGPGQVILTGWGWQRFGNLPGSDGASLSVPLGRNFVDITLHLERFAAGTRQKDDYGQWKELGDQEVWQGGFSIGIRG